jgi:hypothetical protein
MLNPIPSENDSAGATSELNSGNNHLAQWHHSYRSISDLFCDLECPDVFRHQAKTDRAAQILRGLLDQWIKRGRPELAWPESQAVAETPSTLRKQPPRNFDHPDSSAEQITPCLELPYRTGGNTLLLYMTYIV